MLTEFKCEAFPVTHFDANSIRWVSVERLDDDQWEVCVGLAGMPHDLKFACVSEEEANEVAQAISRLCV